MTIYMASSSLDLFYRLIGVVDKPANELGMGTLL